LRIAYTQH